MRIDILSLFPGMFDGMLHDSIPGIAQEKGLLTLETHDIRQYSTNKHRKVDDRPFGGGPGMVLCCQPIVDAVRAVRALAEEPGRLIFLTPEGTPFSQGIAADLSESERLILVCGRYEGFDERIFTILQPERISIGDFVLSGGEPAAAVVVDAVTRLIPGVLGSGESLDHESFNGPLLDHPQYTQPATYAGLDTPEVLRSGDHGRISKWRAEQARMRTKSRRPDLLAE